MEEQKSQIEQQGTEQIKEFSSPSDIRRAGRRKLLKAGLMSVPVIMTVYSRPLFAQSIGSTEALGYGGYQSTSEVDSNLTSRPERMENDNFFENPRTTPSYGGPSSPTASQPAPGSSTGNQPSAPSSSFVDPYEDNAPPSIYRDFSFKRSRDPRER